MKQVETEGETLDAAIDKALSLLGVERDKVSLDVLAEEKVGLLGFGRQNARVRATVRQAVTGVPDGEAEAGPPAAAEAEPPEAEPAEPAEPPEAEPAEPAEPAAAAPRTAPAAPLAAAPAATDERVGEVREASVEVVTRILDLMGVDAEVAVERGGDPSELRLDIRGESSALLIGRRGQTLEALQHLVGRIVADRLGADPPQPVVDVEGYRVRRVRTLEDMALRLGEKAKRSRETQEIESLNAADRRIVHMALKDDPWLTTRSLGQGPYRRLLIVPDGDRKAPETGPRTPIADDHE